jgi:hypothetical protein
MPSLRTALFLALALVAGAALAQSEPPEVARATIRTVSADGTTLTVHTRNFIPPPTSYAIVTHCTEGAG